MIVTLSILVLLFVPSSGLVFPKCNRILKTNLFVKAQKFMKDHVEEIRPTSILFSDIAQFAVNTALAEEFISLRNFTEAERLAKVAMEVSEHTHEVNNIYHAYAEGILGEALYGEENFKEASIHFRNALKTYERHSRTSTSPEAVELIGAIQLISWNLISSKEYTEAISACRVALGMTTRLLGPHNSDVAACMVNLAVAQLQSGIADKSTEGLLKEALNIHQNTSINNNYMGAIHAYLGDTYYLRGDEDKALKSYSKVEKMYNSGKFPNGREADFAGASLRNLGLILSKKGRELERAELLLEKSLSLFESNHSYGPDDAATIMTKQALDEMKIHHNDLRRASTDST